MLENLSRTTAARYTAFAAVPLVLGIGGVVWALQSSAPDHNAAIENIKPVTPAPTGKPTDSDSAAAAPQTVDHAPSIASRLAALKNHPIAHESTGPIPPPDEITPGPTGTSLAGDIKYVGPIRFGDLRLAILNIEGKQQTVSPGKSVSYTANETSHSFKVLDVSDTEVTVEQESTEHKITRADDDGERITYLGNRPTRSGKPVTMNKRPASNPMAGHPSAVADYEARKAEAMGRLAPQLDQMYKSKPEKARVLRDKMTEELKRNGLDPNAIEEVLGSGKPSEEK